MRLIYSEYIGKRKLNWIKVMLLMKKGIGCFGLVILVGAGVY